MMSAYSGIIELMAETPANAHAELAQACTMLEQIGERHRLATVAAVFARVLYAEGRYDESQHYTQISEEVASEDDVSAQVLWRGTRGKALARAGDSRLAQGLADTEVELAHETDSCNLARLCTS